MPTQRFKPWDPVPIGDLSFDAALRTAGETMAERWALESDRLSHELRVAAAAQAMSEEMWPSDAMASSAATALAVSALESGASDDEIFMQVRRFLLSRGRHPSYRRHVTVLRVAS